MAGKTHAHRDVSGRHYTDPQVRVVVMVVFLINFHTWGMNSVSCSLVNNPKIYSSNLRARHMRCSWLTT